jgi:hypothetical protein
VWRGKQLRALVKGLQNLYASVRFRPAPPTLSRSCRKSEYLAPFRHFVLCRPTKSLQDVATKHEYQIVFASMPLKRGIEYVRFLDQLVISHHKFAVGAPIVGGSPRIGFVTYKGGGFKILGAEGDV